MIKIQLPFRLSLILLTVFLSALVGVSTLDAQTSSVDPSFNTLPAKSSNALGYSEILPDGKILTFAFGGTRIFNGVPKNQIARLNADGSLDNSFDCAACDFNITSVRVQPNGKIITAGYYSSPGNFSSVARIRRLNPDGSLDNSLASPFGNEIFSQYSGAGVAAIQPDGKILLIYGVSSSGYGNVSIIRLNTDGSYDSAFTTINFAGGRTSREFVSQLRLQTDGKILVSTGSSGFSSSGRIRRYNSDGSLDTTFESPTLASNGGSTVSYTLSDFDILADGSIIIGGKFDTVNSVSRVNIARIMPAGNVDLTSFQTSFSASGESIRTIKILADGKILVVTAPTILPGFPPPANPNFRILRLNANGTVDNTFNAPNNFLDITDIDFDAAGRILLSVSLLENGATVYRTFRLNSDGSIDNSFSVSVADVGTVSTVAVQSDGKAIIGGDFNLINNVSRSNPARVNADGSLDTTFNPGSGFDVAPSKIVVQSDGKILVGGSFTSLNGAARIGIVRLNSDGSLDNGFTAVLMTNAIVNSIALRADGKIYVGGFFSSVNGQTRNGIALLNTDGTLDASFNPAFGSSTINSIAVQTDGKVLVGGSFSGVNGFNRSNLVRLNADGTLDSTFNAGSISTVKQVEVQNGKYVVYTDRLLRLNSDGTTDSTFQAAVFTSTGNNTVTFIVQPDGTIIAGGNFSNVNSVAQSNIARLKTDGSVDTLFLSGGANAPVNALARTADGKVLVGGNFTIIGGVTKIAVARLIINPVFVAPARTPFDFDGDGRADVSVFRPSTGFWYTSQNAAVNYGAFQFGAAGDKLVPADYDGDGKTDIAVVRNGTWYIQRSTLGFTGITFGLADDIPVPADYDGDGKADVAVFRPSNGTWYLQRSSLGYTYLAFGLGTDKPVPADYDGDGKAEVAVYRPSNGFWYNSTNPATNYGGVQFGVAEDKPVPADYDGDGKIDRAVYRPSNGTWYLLRSTAGFTGIQFGIASDLPVAADYDGDGKADVAVVRNGIWYLNRTTAGFTGIQFGYGDDKPLPNVFVR